MGYTDKALMAHIKSSLHQVYNHHYGQVLTIGAGDTTKFYKTLAEMGLPENVVCVILGAARTAQTGNLMCYPGSDPMGLIIGSQATITETHLISVADERVQFARQIQNSEWTVWCMGYWTEGQVLG